MIKTLPFLLLLLSLSVVAQVAEPKLTWESENPQALNHHASHWLVSFGFEGLAYEVPFEFEGERKNFRPNNQELYGGRLGLGRQFYLGKGFVTSTKIEGYYVGTLFEKAVTAAPEEETQTFSFTKKTGQVFGGELVQSLGYMFNLKTKNPFLDEMTYLVVEPFIEAGIGIARAYNRTNYHYDTGPANVQEDYHHRVNDELSSARLGVGLNFTANTGFYFYLKASQQRYDVLSRKEEGKIKQNSGSLAPFERKPNNVNLDPIMVYSFGGGYKF